MAYHGFALQEAIYSTLNVSSLNNLVTGVFDTVPDDTTLPVVIIGSQTTNDGATKNLDGRDYIFNVDTHNVENIYPTLTKCCQHVDQCW